MMKKGIYQWIWLMLILASCTPKGVVEFLTQPPAKEVNYAHCRWGTTVETFPPWASPGHPAITVIDGEIDTERGWRHWGDIRESIAHRRVNVYPELLDNYSVRWARARQRHAPYVELRFGKKRPLNKIVIYTIDSAQYPAKEYGIRAYRLYFMNEFGRWMLLAKENNNSKGRIEHAFSTIRTEAIKLQILETNDVAALRQDKDWEIRKIGKRLIKKYGSSGFRSSDKVRSLLQRLPCPLKYISTVIEIEAYGPLLDASAEIPPFAEIAYPKRYTGKWQIYRARETDGMESDYVWTAEVDENCIWFGSSRGLLCYDKEKDKWTTYQIPFRPNDSQGILDLAVEKDKIWVGTSSHFYNLVDRFYGYTEQKANADKSEMEELVAKWALWTTEQKDGIYTLDKETKKWTVVKEGLNNTYFPIFHKFRNKIIIYGRDGKSLIYEADFPKYPPEEKSYEELWEWVSARGGFRERRLKSYVQDIPKSMVKNLPETLVRQNDGDSYRIGVPMGFSARLYFPPQFTFNASTDSGIVLANALYDSDKVHSWNYGYSRKYFEADGLSNQNVQDMVNDGDYVWMATVDGVSRLDLLTDTWERFNVVDGLPHRFATCLAVDNDSVWIGTRQGIARYRKIFVPEEVNH
ncbi:MAG: hypothetical protein ACE5PV_24585 [Candidatus Poribacteria bacterium]